MPTSEIALRDNQTGFDQKQLAVLAQLGLESTTPADLAVFFDQCVRRGLDPFTRQIYMLPRRTMVNGSWVVKQTVQTGIDGFRLIAHRADKGYSLSKPKWLDKDGKWQGAWSEAWGLPVAARYTLTKSNGAMVTAVANFDEYKQTNKEGKRIAQWATKPAFMLQKCCEALVLRMAYPEELSGLYTDDELDASSDEVVAPVVKSSVVKPVASVLPPAEIRPADDATAVKADRVAPPRPKRQPALAPAPAPQDAVDAEVVEAEIVGYDPAEPAQAEMLASKLQLAQVHVLLGERDLGGDGHHEVVSGMVGREITSCKQLTRVEASRVIGQLKDQGEQAAPAKPCTREQREAIGREITRLGMSKDDALQVYTQETGHEVTATIDLSIGEAVAILKALRAIGDGPLVGDEAQGVLA